MERSDIFELTSACMILDAILNSITKDAEKVPGNKYVIEMLREDYKELEQRLQQSVIAGVANLVKQNLEEDDERDNLSE